MKKISFLAFGLLAAVLSFGQHASFGIKGGVNIANYSPEAGSVDSRVGFHVGALAHIHVAPDVALQPEVVYSSQGAKFINSTDKLDYINIPVLLQYMFGEGFRLETGPQLGINVGSTNVSTNGNEARLNDVKSTDFVWAFGLGYLTRSGFGVDARYNLGLSNIAIPDYGIKNRVWQFGVFYQFHH
jgi:Outer membrane protein beta-barrel domain